MRALATMNTNNIDSNKCEEKADRVSLCAVAEGSEQADEVCASCGIAEVDKVKLKKCTCELVKYCSDKCRDKHREQHEEECKKRMEELRDKKLFTQPDSSCFGECPICFLPMPLDMGQSIFYSCCSKIICKGCEYAHHKSNGRSKCPFCREPTPDKEEYDRRRMKRIEANDPAAMFQVGVERRCEGDYDTALGYFTKAAELEDVEAHFDLGFMYAKGQGVEKDEEKEVYHYEKAAIGGHPIARHNLGCIEERNGRDDRAVKHWIISAKLGDTVSMKGLWGVFREGNITKEDLEATLRAHHAAIDATKSPQREAAEAFYGENK